jgi:cytochrome P450
VPAELVFDYDHMVDVRLAPDAHEGAAAIAAAAPAIFFTPRYCGHWVVTRRADVAELARDVTHLSTRRYNLFGVDEPLTVLPMMLDPPEHGRFRAPLSEAFSPKAMKALEPQVRHEATALVLATRERQRCDFVQDIAEPLPMKMFMRMTGMPLDMFDEFRHWVVRFFRTTDDAERHAIYGAVWNSMTQVIEERQRERKDDVISRLIDARIEERNPTKEELQRYSMQLFFGGLDTLVHALSHSFCRLAREPALQEKLRADPTLIGAAADELLRLYGIVTPLRMVVADFDYQGVPFRSGDMVMLHLPAANRDPHAFAQPGAFELGRRTAHLTFNTGPHTCPGAFLSRLELKTLLEVWLEHMPPFQLDPDDPPITHAGIVYAVDRLPLRWNS